MIVARLEGGPFDGHSNELLLPEPPPKLAVKPCPPDCTFCDVEHDLHARPHWDGRDQPPEAVIYRLVDWIEETIRTGSALYRWEQMQTGDDRLLKAMEFMADLAGLPAEEVAA